MMMNLFSIFDPSTSNTWGMNWLSMLFMFCLLTPMYWLSPPPWQTLFLYMMHLVIHETAALVKKTPFVLVYFLPLFLLIALNNSLGLFPYVFTATSHMIFTVSLALPIWLALILYCMLNNTSSFLLHTVPSGTPFVLMPFMVIIESISQLIRPFTLAVRLAANMIAGHLLMVLLMSSTPVSPLLTLPLLLITQITLTILETAVALIQAYVFMTLVTLYSAESTN